MPRNGCSTLHGVNPTLEKKQYINKILEETSITSYRGKQFSWKSLQISANQFSLIFHLKMPHLSLQC